MTDKNEHSSNKQNINGEMTNHGKFIILNYETRERENLKKITLLDSDMDDDELVEAIQNNYKHQST